MVLGEAEVESWEKVLLNQGEVLVVVNTARHHGLPPLAGQNMQRALFTQWTPDNKHVNVLPNTTHLDPPADPLLKKFFGPFGQQEVPTYGQLLFVCVWGGCSRIWGWPWRTFGMPLLTPPSPG